SILFTALLFFAGCGENSKNEPVTDNASQNEYAFDSTALKTETAENPNQSFFLRYKLNKGEKVRYRVTSIMENKQHIVADTVMDQNVKQTVVYLLDVEPIDVDADSVTEIKMTIKSIKVNAMANQEAFSFETSTTKDTAEIKKFAEYAALANNPFSLRLSKLGEVLEVFRADKIVNQYLQIKGYADSLNADDKVAVRSQIITTGLKPVLTQIFRELPQKMVAKDSVWSFAQPSSRLLVFQIDATTVYKITGLEKLDADIIAVFDASLKTKVEGKTKYSERGVDYDFKKPVTTATGKVYFDVSNGMILKSKTDISILMSNTMEMNSPKGRMNGSQTENQKIIYIVEKL
ncbi:MAG: hypothetical protein K8H86_09225, partial [Ignavibacteriaceae bacterium]|nr:hypothetical protein [Ignavibacteriaceae bacterium]